jgi:hemerythrin-like domain-containing protein
MASMSPVFRTTSEKIHHEHVVFLNELDELDVALDRLAHEEGAGNDPAAADKVEAYGVHLAKTLPDHCRKEEEKMLGLVAGISQELQMVVEEVKRQHRDLTERSAKFLKAIEDFENAADRDAAAKHLREIGHAYTRAIRSHIELEEKQLSGFL